jgi:hypothetical protein
MVWCVIPLEQVLVLDTFTLEHGQLQTGEGRFASRIHALQNLLAQVSELPTFVHPCIRPVIVCVRT